MAKNYEELKLSDDFMFGKVIEDVNLCREVLECLLGKPVGELKEMEDQCEYRFAMDGKPIRLDMYTRDGRAVCDAETQNLNHLFICTFDPFGQDLPQYTFRNRCDEEPELVLQDGTVKYFFNCTCEGEEIPENMQALFKYIMTGETVDELTEKLREAVEAGRRNEKWRAEYRKGLVYEDDLREEGRANTEREKARVEQEKAKSEK
ncbi:MAG: hypothetical protein ACI4HQ_09340 [Acetatifactor sp.]